MSHSYKTFLQLLGTHSTEKPYLDIEKQFGRPTILGEGPQTEHLFSNVGVSVGCMDTWLWSVCFHLSTAMVRSGEIESFTAALPLSINSKDGPGDVKKKIGVEPFESAEVDNSSFREPKDLWEHYLIGSNQFLFIFDMLENQISMVNAWVSMYDYPEVDDAFLGSFGEAATRCLTKARELSVQLQHGYISGLHLLLGILDVHHNPVISALNTRGLNFSAIQEFSRRIIKENVHVGSSAPHFTLYAREVLFKARASADNRLVGPSDLLAALIESEDGVTHHIFDAYLVDKNEWLPIIANLTNSEDY